VARGRAARRVRVAAELAAAKVAPFPQWFTQFLNDRQTRKPSAHTMKAYRQDFVAIAVLGAASRAGKAVCMPPRTSASAACRTERASILRHRDLA
jgi:hypothetical protein